MFCFPASHSLTYLLATSCSVLEDSETFYFFTVFGNELLTWHLFAKCQHFARFCLSVSVSDFEDFHEDRYHKI